ncbi:Serine hydroxymethyltransferase [Lactococcus lactis]|nr:Serine hydroxymethyltransferase [Lactococcus lactis]
MFNLTQVLKPICSLYGINSIRRYSSRNGFKRWWSFDARSFSQFFRKNLSFCPYGVNPQTELLDYEEILKIAKEVQPKLIVAGASAYSRLIDFAKFRQIADSVGAKLMVDMVILLV